MTEAPTLTTAALARLEEAVHRKDPELVARLAPGLADTQIDELVAPLGLTLPEEARLWWGWHDGIHAPTVTGMIFGPGFQLLPLEGAIAEYRERLELADELSETIPNVKFWDPGWFPLIAAGSGLLIFGCTGNATAPTPVRYFHVERAGEEPGRPQARSLGELVDWWIDAVEEGVWYYDRELDGWDYAREVPDRQRRASGLV